jgi:hypothetical protein
MILIVNKHAASFDELTWPMPPEAPRTTARKQACQHFIFLAKCKCYEPALTILPVCDDYFSENCNWIKWMK